MVIMKLEGAFARFHCETFSAQLLLMKNRDFTYARLFSDFFHAPSASAFYWTCRPANVHVLSLPTYSMVLHAVCRFGLDQEKLKTFESLMVELDRQVLSGRMFENCISQDFGLQSQTNARVRTNMHSR